MISWIFASSILARIKSLLWGSKLARLVLAALAGLIALKSYGVYQQSIGATKVVERSIKAGEKINAKNRKVRQSASKPGAAERVRNRYCRDCGTGG